ncbi:MAG: DinB family protein [Candidatus Kapaibacterium sp.]
MVEKIDVSKTHLAYGDLENELAITRRVLERVPEDKFDWKPHEKSFSLRTLAFHLANLLFWQKISLTESEFDLASSPPPEKGGNLPGKEDLLAIFDKNAEEVRAILADTEENVLAEPWTLRHGDHALFTSPKADVLRRFGISHMIHHRGQLSLYLRLLDVPVPNIYGPTADEK